VPAALAARRRPGDRTGTCWHGATGRRTLVTMKQCRRRNGRHLPSSPFQASAPGPSGRVLRELGNLLTMTRMALDGPRPGAPVTVGLAARKVRATTPAAWMTRL
jgi:hypothetical protein